MLIKKILLQTLVLVIILTVLNINESLAGRYDGLVKAIDDYMGGGAVVKRSDDDSFVLLGENNNRLRMDHSGHGDKPHFHLEELNERGRYKPAPGTDHRNYFKGE